MKRFRRPLVYILVTQALCLLVGLWMQHRFSVALSEPTSDNTPPVNSVSGLPLENGERGSDHQPNESDLAVAISSQAASEPGLTDRSGQSRYKAWTPYLFAFIWTMALQGVCVTAILFRIASEQNTEHQKQHQESLSQTRDLLQTRDAVIFGLAQLAESRDNDTGQHLERISLYSTRLAAAARRDPRFQSRITPSFVRLIGISSALHDIGKVSIADSILLKPGPLSDSERHEMKEHAIRGADCISKIEDRLGNCNFLQMAKEIASSHHERWDGSGYPEGLKGEEIPLSARIVAIADVYDALRSKRTYKDSFSHEQTVEMISAESGQQFDPALVEVFLKIQYRFFEISGMFDSGEISMETLELEHAEV